MKTLLLFLSLTTFAPAQQWYPVVPSESTTTSVTLPAGTQYRFGAANCANPVAGSATPGWQVATLTAPQTINPVSMAGGTASFGFADPCYGVVKELDVLETAAVQNISMTVNGVTKIVTVPALPPPPVPPITFTCPGTAKGTLTGTVIGNLTFTQTGPCVTGANQ